MDKLLEFKLSNSIIKAEYQHAVLPEHVGNPLVEALPPFHQAADMINFFGKFPDISDNDHLLPVSTRMLAVSRLNNYLEPLPSHFDVIDKIGLNIRAGYTHRNPETPEYKKALVEFYRQAMEDGNICPIGGSTPSTAPSFALFGTSGVGKTTVVERALSFLPQVLLHETRNYVQIVWMKVDCPPDGSLKQLLSSMIVNFDNMLGTADRDILTRSATIDKLILDVAKLAAMHNLGMLIIDEIQNLLDASGVGQAKMLNFFLTFANVVKIPVLTIGTPRALELMEGQFRSARRVGDHGTYIWDRLKLGNEWTFFIEGFWKYQWVTKPMPLTSDLSNILYDKTQGIHALVIRLFQLAQLQAIRDRSECLTKKLIADVAEHRFKLVAPMLNALRSRSMRGNTKFDKHFEDLFVNGLNEINTDFNNETRLCSLKAQAQTRSQISAERSRAVSALLVIGFDEDQVNAAVTHLFDSTPNMTCDTAVRTFLEFTNGATETDGTSENESLKAIIQNGAASGQSPLSALASAGVIASPLQRK